MNETIISDITTYMKIKFSQYVVFNVPMITSRSVTINGYRYDASSPTICVRKNSTTYYAVKSRTAVAIIPAGTYTPSAFKTAISAYVNLNSYRSIKNSCRVQVNGQTVTVNANQNIYYSQNGSSPGGAQGVGFGVNPYGNGWQVPYGVASSNGFTNYKLYIVQMWIGVNGYYVDAFRRYTQFSITLLDDLVFN